MSDYASVLNMPRIGSEHAKVLNMFLIFFKIFFQFAIPFKTKIYHNLIALNKS